MTRLMNRIVWELEDIKSLPEFGGDVGWFYGLVRHHEKNKIELCEIFPGLGYATAFPLWDKHEARYVWGLPKTLWFITKDLWWARSSRSPLNR